MSSATKQAAQKYYDLGMTPIPVKFKDKKPSISGWQNRTLNNTSIANDFPEGVELNIGIVLGDASNKTADIDLDCIEAVRIADRILPKTDMIFGRDSSPNSHWIYRVSNCSAGTKYSDPTDGGVLVEYRGNGGQTVFPPSIHTSGEAITFSNDGEPAEVDHDALLHSVKCLAAASLIARHWKSGGRHDLALALSGALLRSGWFEGDVRGFIENVCIAAGDNEVHDRLKAVSDTQAAMDNGKAATGFTRLSQLLGEPVVKRLSEWLNLGDGNMIGHNSSGAANDNVLRCTDIGNAELFAEQHRHHLRYCYDFGSSLVWNGKVWRVDDRASIDRFAEQSVKSFVDEADATSDRSERENLMDWIGKSGNRHRMTAMASQSWHRLQIEQSQLDADPMLLNLDGVSINLTDGTNKPSTPADYCTKIAATKFDPDAKCPQFLEFLDRIMGGSEELKRYLQRAAGYSLTGNTGEQCFFIAHGSGANGKSVFLNLLRDLMGNYGDTVPMNTLMAMGKTSGIPNDIARLNGARMVTASEGERQQKLATAFIKQITGGDPVMARFLFKEFFWFVPVLKLWMATNHKPQIPADDPAMWRRIHLIPFNVVIPAAEQDKDLPQKLRGEMSGILNWAIKGAIEWHQEGLKPPKEVLSAIDDYKSEMDTFSSFLKDMVITNVETTTSKRALVEAYNRWRLEEGGDELSMPDITSKMKQLGYVDGRRNSSRHWKGIELEVDIPEFDDFKPLS